MRDLTAEEREVILILDDAWNVFVGLAPVHSADEDGFRHAIHAAQNIVMARPATEAERERDG